MHTVDGGHYAVQRMHRGGGVLVEFLKKMKERFPRVGVVNGGGGVHRCTKWSVVSRPKAAPGDWRVRPGQKMIDTIGTCTFCRITLMPLSTCFGRPATRPPGTPAPYLKNITLPGLPNYWTKPRPCTKQNKYDGGLLFFVCRNEGALHQARIP